MFIYIIFAVSFSDFVQFGYAIDVTHHNPASIRLQDGVDRCQGLVQFYNQSSNTSLQSCSFEAGDEEVRVICRQLGCNTENARRVDSTSFGYSGAKYFTYFNYSCTGNEPTLSSCYGLNIVDCTTSDVHSAVAANCGGDGTINGQTNVNEVSNSKVLIIIVCSIVGSLIVIVVVSNVVTCICCVIKRRTQFRSFDMLNYTI